MSEPTIWGMHAGKTGDAGTLFLKKNPVGVPFPVELWRWLDEIELGTSTLAGAD